MKQGLFAEWKWQGMENGNGKWQWRTEMEMEISMWMSLLLLFVGYEWIKEMESVCECKWKVWSGMRWMVYYEVWMWWMDVMETIVSESFSSVWIWFCISIFPLCCWSSSYETNWSLRETPFSCSHLSFLLEPTKKLILLLQWNVRLSKERGDQSL